MVKTIDILKCSKSTIRFAYFRDGSLWFRTVEDDLFPVPVEDVKGTTIYAFDKGIFFLRWMRKYNESISEEYKEMSDRVKVNMALSGKHIED